MSSKSKGLFQQLKNTNTIPYSTGSFGLESMTEIIEAMWLEEYRKIVRLMIQEGIQTGKITLTEKIQLDNLLDSDDKENIYMAEQIAKFKIEQ